MRPASSISRLRLPPLRQLILVVGDERSARNLSRTLTPEGFEVVTVPSAKEARRILTECVVDLVVVDSPLPDDDGLEVARNFARAGPRAPFIVVGADLTVDIAREARDLGAAAVLSQPLPRTSLVAAVRLAMAGQRASQDVVISLDAGSNIERWARLILRSSMAANDPRTIRILAHAAGVSASGFRELCRQLHIRPCQARDLARVLRAMNNAAGDAANILYFLDTRDGRTSQKLLARAGLLMAPAGRRLSSADVVAGQGLVPLDHPGVQALLRLLPRDA